MFKNVFIYTLGIAIFLQESVLALPLLKFKLSDFHDPFFHVNPGTLTTTHRYHDDHFFSSKDVEGRVVRTRYNEGSIVEFDVITTVINNSKKNWDWYIFSYEYAQHSANAWSDEHRVLFGQPQPVLVPPSLLPPGTPIAVYTEFSIPTRGNETDIPGILRPGLAAGATDTFQQTFTIDKGGATVGSNLYNFIRLAGHNDIHWARQVSAGPSDYPQPLGSVNILTQYDNIVLGPPGPPSSPPPATTPPGNTGPPLKGSNVSVYPVLSAPTKQRAKKRGGIGAETSFDPNTGVLSITGGVLDVLEIVEDSSNPVYSTDILLGGDILVDNLTLLFSEGISHFFGGGVVELIGTNGETYLEGDLNLFVSTDFPEDDFMHSYGILSNLTFPTTTIESLWINDVVDSLTIDPFLSLDFSIIPTSGTTLASLITESLETMVPFTTDTDSVLTLNGDKNIPEPSAILGLLISAIALGATKKKQNS